MSITSMGNVINYRNSEYEIRIFNNLGQMVDKINVPFEHKIHDLENFRIYTYQVYNKNACVIENTGRFYLE